MQVTAFRFSARYVHVGYSIQVQCQTRTCRLNHSGPLPDTYMYATASSLSAVSVHVRYSIKLECSKRTCKVQYSGSVPDTYI
jgi:hypothetical protein